MATIDQQADLIGYLIRTAGGAADQGEAWIRLDPQAVEDLKGIEKRLRIMAPHEQKIRRIVTGER